MAILPLAPTPAAAVDAEVAQNDDGGYDLTPIADTETPLANRNIDGHGYCILHFLLAPFVLAFYTRSMKKRQEMIFRLREELSMETLIRNSGREDDNAA